MFRAHVLIIRRSELHYTASGIITPIGGRLVQRLREREREREDKFISCLYMFRAHVLIMDYAKVVRFTTGVKEQTIPVISLTNSIFYCTST